MIETFLWIFFEIFTQVISVLFSDSIHRGYRQLFPAKSEVTSSQIFAATFVALAGAVLGNLSISLFPNRLTDNDFMSILNLLATPLLVATLMNRLGKEFEKRDKPRDLMENFYFAFIFTFTFALVRWTFIR